MVYVYINKLRKQIDLSIIFTLMMNETKENKKNRNGRIKSQE